MRQTDILKWIAGGAIAIGVSLYIKDSLNKSIEKAKREGLVAREEYRDHVTKALEGRDIDDEAIEMTLNNTRIENADDRAYAYGYLQKNLPKLGTYLNKYSTSAFDDRLTRWDSIKRIFTTSTSDTIAAVIASWRDEAERSRLENEKRKSEEAEMKKEAQKLNFIKEMKKAERDEAADIRNKELDKYALLAKSVVDIANNR